jgi:hypothetical protein
MALRNPGNHVAQAANGANSNRLHKQAWEMW